jgi:hypothetical protein
MALTYVLAGEMSLTETPSGFAGSTGVICITRTQACEDCRGELDPLEGVILHEQTNELSQAAE